MANHCGSDRNDKNQMAPTRKASNQFHSGLMGPNRSGSLVSLLYLGSLDPKLKEDNPGFGRGDLQSYQRHKRKYYNGEKSRNGFKDPL